MIISNSTFNNNLGLLLSKILVILWTVNILISLHNENYLLIFIQFFCLVKELCYINNDKNYSKAFNSLNLIIILFLLIAILLKIII